MRTHEDCKSLIAENIEKAHTEVNKAKERLASIIVAETTFDFIYELTLNAQLALQISETNNFDRILNSSQFTEDEKRKVRNHTKNITELLDGLGNISEKLHATWKRRK